MMTNSMNLQSQDVWSEPGGNPLPGSWAILNWMDSLSGLFVASQPSGASSWVAEGLCCHPPGTVGVAERIPGLRPSEQHVVLLDLSFEQECRKEGVPGDA